jgi:hypothetical protein
MGWIKGYTFWCLTSFESGDSCKSGVLVVGVSSRDEDLSVSIV